MANKNIVINYKEKYIKLYPFFPNTVNSYLEFNRDFTCHMS